MHDESTATKRCSDCGEIKSTAEFYALKRASDGLYLTASCRSCNRRKADVPLLDAVIRRTMLAEMENWAARP